MDSPLSSNVDIRDMVSMARGFGAGTQRSCLSLLYRSGVWASLRCLNRPVTLRCGWDFGGGGMTRYAIRRIRRLNASLSHMLKGLITSL